MVTGSLDSEADLREPSDLLLVRSQSCMMTQDVSIRV
jgi:hypothetical protein